MVTVVLCVDRDDDVGRKTGIKGPIIGRDENLKTANLLALADPEDSDSNAIFGAISLYDSLKKEGQDVEVVTLTGDVSVGLKSDRIIEEQLREVIRKLRPENAILVSDGEEDEFVLPIITSLVPVIHVKRIIVRQSKGLESSYYILVKALRDEKIARKIMVPFALIFLAFSISVFIILIWKYFYPNTYLPDPATFGFSFVLLTLGFYFLLRAYRVGTKITNTYARFRKAFAEAKISITSDALAILIIIFGIINSYNSTQIVPEIGPKIGVFLQDIVFWVIGAIIVRESGLLFDKWFHKRELSKGFWTAIVLIIGLGILIYGSILYIRVLLSYISSAYTIPAYIIISLGIILSIFSAVIRKYVFAEEEENELQ